MDVLLNCEIIPKQINVVTSKVVIIATAALGVLIDELQVIVIKIPILQCIGTHRIILRAGDTHK